MSEMPETRLILLVEDSADDRDHVRRLLAKHRPGYRLVEAATAAEGLRLAAERRPDCLLLDYFLPDMDGTEFLDLLSGPGGRMGGPPLPIALLTGKDSDELALEVLNRGAQDYLVKDAITGPALVRAIENAISKFHIQQELDEQRAAVELRNQRLELLREELQQNLADLAEAQGSRDRFLAVMSHEMRTPLNAILGYADLLDMGLEGDLNEGQRKHLDRIRMGGRHLLDLINDVLDLARADAQRLDLDVRPVDLHAIVEEVTALLENQAREKGIRLELVTPVGGMDIPHVEADLQRLRQILTNLVGNALKFTEEGAVTVRYDRAPDGQVRVMVEDTGVGIHPDALPHIFEEFFQANDNLTRERGGSGLGLAISQRLARLMGGEIEVKSEYGTGSTFTLYLLPARKDAALRDEDVVGQAARKDARGGRPGTAASAEPAVVSVVAFGDDVDTLEELARQVSAGVRLTWTTDAAEVPALAVREKAALIVLDISSQGGAGWRAADAVQNEPGLAETAVLLLPAIPSAADEVAEGLDLGWVSLVPKPFSPHQLRRAVTTALHGHDDDERADGFGPVDALIIDDDEDSRRVATTILAEAGARVREASDGESALVKMRKRPPSVVVLDLMMPVLDGFGVLATMRADPLLANIPVVVLTAKSLTEAERQFLGRTAARVLQKGEHRLADVAALVLRAAARAPRGGEDAVAGAAGES